MTQPNIESLLTQVNACAQTEAKLWQLLEQDKRGTLFDEHGELLTLINELKSSLGNFEKGKRAMGANDEFSKAVKKVSHEVDLLVALLKNQQQQLKQIIVLEHAQIVEVLNGNKNGQYISETSQRIRELLNLLEVDLKKNFTSKSNYSFVLLKPSVIDRRIADPIMTELRNSGFEILSVKTITFTQQEILEMYAYEIHEFGYKQGEANGKAVEHEYLTTLSRPCLLLLVYHPTQDAKKILTLIKGKNWNPSRCDHETIRYKYRDHAWDSVDMKEHIPNAIITPPTDNIIHSPKNDEEFMPTFSRFFPEFKDKVMLGKTDIVPTNPIKDVIAREGSKYLVTNDATLFQSITKTLASSQRGKGITKVAGIETTGFFYGAAIAHELGLPFIPIFKGGKIADRSTVLSSDTFKDYSGSGKSIEILKNSCKSNDRVLLVDDWFELGETGKAAIRLIEACGSKVAGVSVVQNQMRPEDESFFSKYGLTYYTKRKPRF